MLRFFGRAKGAANTVNEVINTANKFKMTIQMVRQKFGDLISPGPMTPAKEAYVAYIYEIGTAMSVADGLPETMCQAFVMEEAQTISDLPTDGDSGTLMQQCRVSANGAIGASMGKIDGTKLADRHSSSPYFVELEMWLTQLDAQLSG